MSREAVCVLLVDGGDRQTLPLAYAFRKLNCKVAALNSSRLDLGYCSRYVDDKILRPNIKLGKQEHLNEIEKLLHTGKYDLVVTTSDDTAEVLSLEKSRLETTTKAKICVVEPDLFYMAYDKNQTMKICMDNDIPCPQTFFGIDSVEKLPLDKFVYPLVVKPRKSFGAIGFHRIESEKELLEFCQNNKQYLDKFVFQEYIPQTALQYECAMFVDNNNEVKTSCVFSKNRWFPINGGSSTCNVTVKRQDIIDSCTRLLKKINWRGAADIDLIQDPRDNIAKIMEINPRVSGSVKLVLHANVDIAEQIMQLALGHKVSAYLEYENDVRLRCLHTDLLWFLKSENRFNTTPSWFSWENTVDQVWSWHDPCPFFAFSLQALLKYKREMKKRS